MLSLLSPIAFLGTCSCYSKEEKKNKNKNKSTADLEASHCTLLLGEVGVKTSCKSGALWEEHSLIPSCKQAHLKLHFFKGSGVSVINQNSTQWRVGFAWPEFW